MFLGALCIYLVALSRCNYYIIHHYIQNKKLSCSINYMYPAFVFNSLKMVRLAFICLESTEGL